MRRLLLWPVEHPWSMLAMAGALAAMAVLSILRLRPDTSLEAMFAKNDPSARVIDHVLNDFPAADQLLVLATFPQENKTPDPARLLAFAQRFEDEVHQTPEIGSLADAILYSADEQSRTFVEKVIGPAAMYYLDDEAFNAARERLSREEIFAQIARDRTLLATPGPAASAVSRLVAQDPLRLHEFILDRLSSQRPFHTYKNGNAFLSPDAKSLLIRIIGKQPPNNLDFSRKLTEDVARAAVTANSDGLKLEYAGAYAIATQSERAIRRDMIASVIGSVVLLQLLFVVAYRNAFGLFAMAFGPVALGILLGFGVYGIFWRVLTPLTAALGAVLAGMGIDYSVQLISLYESRRSTGDDPRPAATRCALEMAPAVLAAWATSVVGFLAIGSSRVAALRDFAIIGTLGLSGAFICALMILPTVLMLTDCRRDARSRLRFGARRLVDGLARHRKGWIFLSLAFLLAGVGSIASGRASLPFESDLTVMHPNPSPAIEAQEHIARKFGISPDSMTIYLHANSPEDLLVLAYQVSDRLKRANVTGIVGTFGLDSLLPDPRKLAARKTAVSAEEVNRILADFHAALEENGFSTQAFSGYASFLRALLSNPSPPGLAELTPYLRIAETILPASAFAGEPPAEAISFVFTDTELGKNRQATDAAIRGVRAALEGLDGATVTGLSVAGHDAERTVRRELPRLILAAIAIVAVYLIVHFRNAGDALLALVPAVFGMAIAGAALGLAGQKLDMVNLVAIPLLVGIDVDYGIFLVNAARLRQIRGLSRDQVAGQIEPATHAVCVCAVATILGYISLLWTSIPAEQSLGIAAAVGIGACLVGVLFLLIPILFSLSARA
jgi:predicted RND superfamily exporter protein